MTRYANKPRWELKSNGWSTCSWLPISKISVIPHVKACDLYALTDDLYQNKLCSVVRKLVWSGRCTLLLLTVRVLCVSLRVAHGKRRFERTPTNDPHRSSVASPNIWGAKMFDLGRITLFCLGYRLAKHKMTIVLKIGGGPWPCRSPGYAYASSV